MAAVIDTPRDSNGADATSIQAPVITARALSKCFGERDVVCGIDFAVPRGGCYGLLGPNGAGKTTTLRMILGQSPASGGELEVLGLPMPAAAREVRGRIGVVPQSDNLDPDFSVEENLRVYASYFGMDPDTASRRIPPLLEMVELDDRARSRIATLSGGMKRRLSIARGLVNDPELLVLDEPTTGLDPQVRHLIWNRLRQLKQAGKTLLLTTHYMEEAERLCDELLILDGGRVLSHGHPRALIREHVEPDVVEIQAHVTQVEPLLAGCAGLRLETVGETVYCYTNAAAPVVDRLERQSRLTYLHRPANLEDVFLRLTGRELRD